MLEKEPAWLGKDIIIAIHLRQVAEHGGMGGIRDEGLLDSAINRPLNLYHYSDHSEIDLFDLAAEYAFGISGNHPFVDGNKRVAYVAMMLFLRLNNVEINASQIEKYKIMMQVASGQIIEKDLSMWLAKCCNNVVN